MSDVRGWCPTAWRPMAAGDGLLVRVRPLLGRLTRAQALGLCAAAIAHGNGAIDLTNRANLQLRGVTEHGLRLLLARLVALGCVDPDPVREARRAIVAAPDWRAGDDTHRIARELADRLAELPDLPGKIGFAIDAGCAPALRDDPGDFRIERGAGGGLILRGDGRATGVALAPGTEVDALIALARWFVASGGAGAGRMARHRAALPGWAEGVERPASPAAPLEPGTHPLGNVQPLAFGRIEAQAFADALAAGAACAIRTTPWRMLLMEGASAREPVEASALARVDACVGAPACPQATVDTRDLARRLVPYVRGRLHVSGCAKGCARAAAADVVLTGRDRRYDLAFHARAGAAPVTAGLDQAGVLAQFGAG